MAALGSRDDSSEASTSRQLRGSSVLLSGRVLSVVLNLVTQVLLLRHLSKADFGAFGYALSFVTTARVLVTLGHNRTVTRFLSIYDEQRDHARLLGTLAMESALAFGLGGLLFAGAVGVQGWLSPALIDDPQAASLLVIIIALAPIEAFDDLMEAMCAVLAKPSVIFVRKHVLAPLLRLGTVIVLIVIDAGVRFLAVGYVVSAAVGILLYAGTVASMLRHRGLLAWPRRGQLIMPFGDITRFTLPLMTSELVYISTGPVSIVVLGGFAGTTGVAAFRAVLPAATLNLFVHRSFTLLFLPQVSRLHVRGDRVAMAEAYWRTAAWLAVLTFPIFALTGAMAEPLIIALFGERYASSAPVLSVLAIGMYVNAALGFNVEVLQVTARLRYLATVKLLCVVVDISLVFAVVPNHGALGVAVASAGTLIVQNLLNQRGASRAMATAFVPRRYMSVYLVAALTAGALWAVETALDPTIVPAVALAGVGSIVVLLANRRFLDVHGTFPEIRRIPILRALFTE